MHLQVKKIHIMLMTVCEFKYKVKKMINKWGPVSLKPPLVTTWILNRFLGKSQLCSVYRLSQVQLVEDNTTLCNHTASETHLMGDSSSSVEFFVAVAVLAFLYCMLSLLVYLGYMHVYRDSDFGPAFVSITVACVIHECKALSSITS